SRHFSTARTSARFSTTSRKRATSHSSRRVCPFGGGTSVSMANRRSPMFVVVVALSVALGAAARHPFTPVTDEMLRNASPADWLAWRGTTKSLGYSPLTQITRDNVAQLQLAWSWSMEPGIQEAAPLV